MLKLFFNGDRLEFVPVHHHLGLLISESLSWINFIDSVVNSAFKKTWPSEKTQVQNWQKNLSKLYITCTFIRPMLEYASIVWDSCSKQDAEKLEKVQLTAARIVTGLPIFVSRETLYYETGCETIKTRRYVAKMTNMFKIHTGGVPEYLLNIVPKKREHVFSYNARNKEDYIIPRCRFQLFRNSFIPDV